MRPKSIVSAWILGAIGVLGIAADAFGIYSTFAPFVPLPLRTAAPWIFLFLCFCLLWWEVRNPAAARDVDALHRSNTNLQDRITELETQLRPRLLTPGQSHTISAEITAGLADLNKEETREERRVKIQVSVIAAGADNETIAYRDALADALDAGGLAVQREEWLLGTNTRRFSGKLTLLRTADDERNRVRLTVKHALARAGLGTDEAPYPLWRGSVHKSPPIAALHFIVTESKAFLVVGTR